MFKKFFIYSLIIFILVGCDSNKSIYNNLDDNINEDISNVDTYIDNNPLKVSLYNNKNKVTSYSTTLSNFKDIGVFDIYFTDVDMVESSNTKINYQKYCNDYENIENYKTGFYISFMASDDMIEEVILDPSKQHEMTPYLYIYLYDDVNQTPGTYYSHLEPKDMKENTVFSSIKLFLAQEGVKITSPITLTVFTYDSEDDFDDNGMYRGNSSYTVNIDTGK